MRYKLLLQFLYDHIADNGLNAALYNLLSYTSCYTFVPVTISDLKAMSTGTRFSFFVRDLIIHRVQPCFTTSFDVHFPLIHKISVRFEDDRLIFNVLPYSGSAYTIHLF